MYTNFKKHCRKSCRTSRMPTLQERTRDHHTSRAATEVEGSKVKCYFCANNYLGLATTAD